MANWDKIEFQCSNPSVIKACIVLINKFGHLYKGSDFWNEGDTKLIIEARMAIPKNEIIKISKKFPMDVINVCRFNESEEFAIPHIEIYFEGKGKDINWES